MTEGRRSDEDWERRNDELEDLGEGYSSRGLQTVQPISFESVCTDIL